MVFQGKTLALVAGLTISSIALYIFMKIQKKRSQCLDAVSPNKFKNADNVAVLQDYNSDSESPTKLELFEPVEAFSYYQETLVENILFTKCEGITVVEPHFVNATIGTALEEAFNYENDIHVEDIMICNQDLQENYFQQVSQFRSDAEEIHIAVFQAQAQETALEEALNNENKIQVEEITISQEKVFLSPTRQPKATQEMSILSRINLKFWLLLAAYCILVIYSIVFFKLD